ETVVEENFIVDSIEKDTLNKLETGFNEVSLKRLRLTAGKGGPESGILSEVSEDVGGECSMRDRGRSSESGIGLAATEGDRREFCSHRIPGTQLRGVPDLVAGLSDVR